MRDTVTRRYEAMAQAGEIEPNDRQFALAAALDRLALALEERERTSKKSALGWLLARGGKPAAPRGIYIWGGVGRGKTLLMDLFFAVAPLTLKRRVHFHAFMGEVHDRIDQFRRKLKSGEAQGDDPIEPVAAAIASEARLLCFDELAVYDIADAMILGRLFEQLFARGVTLVATSNVAPDELYKDGLNRPLFLPFIELLRDRAAEFHLDAPRDYRLDDAAPGPLYVTPLGPAADACLDAHFRRLTGTERGKRMELAYKRRTIVIPEAANGVARLAFEDLCVRPLGAGDYLTIAAAFHTIILSGVPKLGPSKRNEAKRLINLIDTLYDNRVRLVVSAEAEPDQLWQEAHGVESFEFARTASRLAEMRSPAYWESATEIDADTKTARAS